MHVVRLLGQSEFNPVNTGLNQTLTGSLVDHLIPCHEDLVAVRIEYAFCSHLSKDTSSHVLDDLAATSMRLEISIES